MGFKDRPLSPMERIIVKVTLTGSLKRNVRKIRRKRSTFQKDGRYYDRLARTDLFTLGKLEQFFTL
jgi:hypothetical protein